MASRHYSRLCASFYDAALADPILAPVFTNFTGTHVDHVAVWLAEVFSGQARFTEEHGGHPALLRHHLGLSITEEQRICWMELMAAAVDKELPDDDLLRRTILEYFDWGTKIARDVSGAPVGADLGDPGPHSTLELGRAGLTLTARPDGQGTARNPHETLGSPHRPDGRPRVLSPRYFLVDPLGHAGKRRRCDRK